MTNATADVAAEIGVEYVHHVKRGLLTRLTWRGWDVDIDGPNVTVPRKAAPGKPPPTWPRCSVPPTR